jgi:hypothetical protein
MKKLSAFLFALALAAPFSAFAATPAEDIANAVNTQDSKAVGAAGLAASGGDGGDKSNPWNREKTAEEKTKEALGVAAMGIGGMQLASGLAQNAAEKAGAAKMESYQNTWMCGVGTADTDGSGRVNWKGETVKAGQVGTAPTVPELQRLVADFTIKQNQIRAAKGEIDMLLTPEEQKTFSGHSLYSSEGAVEEGELYHVSTGGGNTKVAIGAGLAGGGMVMSAGGDYKTAIGTGMLTGGGAGALVADTTAGKIGGAATALGGAGVLAHGAKLLPGQKKD